MTMEQSLGAAEKAAVLNAVRAGDQTEFSARVEGHRGELRAFCYRMLGSFDDAEDLVQETFLRAWRGRETFAGRATLRAWLYGIASHACIDFLARNHHRVLDPATGERIRDRTAAPVHVAWLQPYPDNLLETAAPREAEPDAATAARESIGLAFMVAMQFLPAKQRAALILCDVLEWSANEAAELLELSVSAVNSALQRARTTLREHQPDLMPRFRPGLDPDQEQRRLLQRYVEATERGDVAALAATLREDLRFAMPPQPETYVGRDSIVEAWVKGGFGSAEFGDFKCALTQANGAPAVGCYVRRPGGQRFEPMALDVLQIEDGLIREITTFSLEVRSEGSPGWRLWEGLGLPAAL